MADPKKSVYARLASRFAHLALGAKEEDEEEEDRPRAEDEADDDEDGAPENEGKKAKKMKRAEDEEDEDEDEPKDRADEEDGDGEENAKRKKALCIVKAHAEGRAFERARWSAVMSSKAAAGRLPLACSLLTDTRMSAEKVCAALLASPTEARQGLAARMAAVPRPDVGAHVPGADAPDPSTPNGRAAIMRGAYDKATGRESK